MNYLCKPYNVAGNSVWIFEIISFSEKIADVFIVKNCLIFGCGSKKSANPQILLRYKGTAKMHF